MKPTLAEVAKAAGVSQAAVSLVLRDQPQAQRFNADTRLRIKRIAEELGYRTNFFASQLRQSSSKVLMLYVKSLEDTYSASIAEAFQQRARERRYWTMITVTAGGRGSNVLDRQIIGVHGVSAVALIGGAAEQLSQQAARTLLEERVSLLVVGRSHRNSRVNQVLVDDYGGSRALAEHVFTAGARTSTILTLTTRKNISQSMRIRGYMDCARDLGMPEPDLFNIQPHFEPAAIAREAYDFARHLTVKGRPDAIFANTDIRAMGVMKGLADQGLVPGRDIAVVGYDDIWQSQFLSPGLTTVHQPTNEMGRAAADVLIDVVEGAIETGQKRLIQPALAVRETSSLVR